MEDIEAKKKVLEDLIMNALTIDSDEAEGMLTINLYEDVNLCNPDNNAYEEPEMTPEEINTLFHFNDPEVSPSANEINKDDISGTWSGSGTWKKPDSMINNGLIPGENEGDVPDDTGSADLGTKDDLGGWSGTGIWEGPTINGTWTGDGTIDKTGKWIGSGIWSGPNGSGPWTGSGIQDDSGKLKGSGKWTGDGISGTWIGTGEQDDSGKWSGVGKWVKTLDDSNLNADDKNGDNSDSDNETSKIKRDFEAYNNISIPKDANIDDIVKAIINDKNKDGLNYAIVEFAQPSIRDEKGVDFNFYVKPGQLLTANTIIAKATINGVSKEVRSIFGSGVVMATDDGSDYKRLYNDYNANRHIVIKDYEYCGDAPEINTDMIDKALNKFKDHACLFQLITDNIAESILPSVLLNRYLEYKYYWIGIAKIRDVRKNGRELFGEYLEDVVQPIRDSYQKDVKNMASVDAVKQCNGNAKKFNALGNSILDRRNQYFEQILWCYNEARKQIEKSEYDPEYSDCKYLAADYDIPEGKRETHTRIGSKDFNNYYLALLSKIDISSENQWCQKYFDVLKKIIERRISIEAYSLNEIINEFNSWFKSRVNGNYENPWKSVDDMMKATKGEGTYSDVVNWISDKGSSTDSDAYLTYQQLANIYMFVYKYSPHSISDSFAVESAKALNNGVHQLYYLVQQEWNEIQEFWSSAISEYRNTTIDKCIKAIKDIPNQIQQYHTWPAVSYFQIGRNSFEHYIFLNTAEVKTAEDVEDEDMGASVEGDVTAPDIPTEMDAPAEQPVSSLNDNQIDPTEPTIKDFAYWVRYFALATVISLPYLNCGLDIPPFVMMIPLPCIFICVGCVYIKIFDIVIVFGISIRGMYIWPIVLFVNVGNMTASILTPLIGLIKSLISKLSAKLNSLAEKPVTSIAVGFTNMIEADNKRLRKENKQLDVYISQIKTKKVKNMEKIKKLTLKSLVPTANLKQQVVNPIQSMYAKENNKK